MNTTPWRDREREKGLLTINRWLKVGKYNAPFGASGRESIALKREGGRIYGGREVGKTKGIQRDRQRQTETGVKSQGGREGRLRARRARVCVRTQT